MSYIVAVLIIQYQYKTMYIPETVYQKRRASNIVSNVYKKIMYDSINTY